MEEKKQSTETAGETQRDDQDWYEQLCQTIARTLRWLIIGVVVVLIILILAAAGGIPEGALGIVSALGPLFGG